uniref:Uncharacterized protein n=1 Tax=Leersia perrieri TaxID=77586 RepID=A0A0D9WH96_9ORYZ
MADHGRRRRSTTTALTLSALRRASASFASSNAASAHALSDSALSTPFTTASPPPAPAPAPAGGGSTPFGRGDGGPLLRKHALTTSHAISLVTTSQSPSLARIRHSSSSLRSVTVTSGSDVTYGFKYPSPARPTALIATSNRQLLQILN